VSPPKENVSPRIIHCTSKFLRTRDSHSSIYPAPPIDLLNYNGSQKVGA
jgi:hypothetical protein